MGALAFLLLVAPGSTAVVDGEDAAYAGQLTLAPGGGAVIDIGSTNILTLSGFQNLITGAFPADATVAAQLLTPNNSVVASFSLPYVAGTTGEGTLYRAVLRASLTAQLTAQKYLLVVTATDAHGNKRVFELLCTAVN